MGSAPRHHSRNHPSCTSLPQITRLCRVAATHRHQFAVVGCPAPPAAEPLPESAVIGIAVAAGVAGLALIFILYMINREKSGKPIFYDIKTASSGVTTASATSA